ncbi:MAG TPA: hypothetical protein VNX40_00720 [Mucilaginibacter sp.]|jgi:hypothetical protein|nr:hypothetical protein [Mucilaginibacter sp.]
MQIDPQETFNFNDKQCIQYLNRFRSSKRFLASFRRKYTTIVAYHATNINEKERLSIQTNGLKRASSTLFRQKAIDRFILPTDPIATQMEILEIIDNHFWRKVSIGEINLVIDNELLTHRDAYHYLLFGPESLLPLADDLRKKFNVNFRNRMIEFGEHAIVKVIVPVSLTDDTWINNIYDYYNEYVREICLVIKEDLHQENIIEIKNVPRPYDYHNFLYY